jgi:hypothetical protein
MLHLENVLLAIAIVGGAYAWHRAGFRRPRWFPIRARVMRRLVGASGWLLLVGITVKSMATAFFGDGRVQVARFGKMYAYRAREPALFWGEVIGEMLLIGGMAIALILIGRDPMRRRSRAAPAEIPPWRSCPFEVGTRYRITREHRGAAGKFTAGEQMVFESHAWSRYDEATGYFFRDDRGAIRRFDVYDDEKNPGWEVFTKA